MANETYELEAILAYNEALTAEPNRVATTLAEYWVGRRARCQNMIERQNVLATDNGAEKEWSLFCSFRTDFLKKYLKDTIQSLSDPLKDLWKHGKRLAKEAERAFATEAKVEIWIPYLLSPPKFVRIPGSNCPYDFRELSHPAGGSFFELGKCLIAVLWRNEVFFVVVPPSSHVAYLTFTYTMDGTTWDTVDVLPRVFAEKLKKYQTNLHEAERLFAALHRSWEEEGKLQKLQQNLIQLTASVEKWRQVHLPERQKLEILQRAELFEMGDPAAPRGLLLCGPPGTGKTLVARTLADTTSSYFQTLSLPDLKEQHLGASGRRVREVWDQARAHQPSIIFIDECEGIFGRRGAAETDIIATDIVQAFLSEWDGLRGPAQVWVIGATNRRDMLDDAILSRFGWEMELTLPHAEDRKQILAQEMSTLCNGAEVPEEMATLTQGMSGRDLQQLAGRVRAMAYPTMPARNHFLEAVASVRKTNNAHVDQSATWDTLVVEPAVLDHLKLTCSLLRDAEKWRSQGISIPRSLLLIGPPGSGKTQIARTLANESGLGFLAATTADVKANFLGQSGNRVKQLFERARSSAPVILFLDELDIIAPDRMFRSGSDQLTDEIVGQLLQEMDGIRAHENQVFLLAATNRLEQIDSAIRSRFEEKLMIPLPDRDARIRLLTIMLSGKKLSFPPHDGAVLLADLSEGHDMSGRDLDSWVRRAEQKALVRAVRNGGPEQYAITIEDFDLPGIAECRTA